MSRPYPQEIRAHAIALVVDVLSFTTSVTVAVEAATHVFPYRWRDESAESFAKQKEAALAVGRRAANEESPWSLSPAALRHAPFVPRLVLPSPNGSAIAAAAGDESTVIAASLRNATAVGQWLAAQGLGTIDRPVAVIAAGEKWPDGSLRPAAEDLLGAGAVVTALLACAGQAPSPEAAMASAAFTGTPDPHAAVASSPSGRELGVAGFTEDVAIATELDASQVVPVLTGGAFVDAV
ncbi:2-phosphosulfolactate phosphatase [Streptomyces sp. cg28]|uniref:2-phosphosulfolactate phosphatase n=1 Tax=Streptomyces sp. cg28 TaxID=3403457 RepID=UPI003B223082